MILNDTKIAELTMYENLFTSFVGIKYSFVRGENVASFGLGSCSYDLRLSDNGCKKIVNSGVIDIKEPKGIITEDIKKECDSSGSFYILEPQTHYLVSVVEKIKMPTNLAGILLGKSTYNRVGLLAQSALVDPGREGFLSISLFNSNRTPLKIYINEGIIQIVFINLNDIPYAPYDGKYQNQVKAPLHSAFK